MERTENIGIIPFTYFRGSNKPAGSSFLRVDALVQNNPDFEKWQHGKKYKALIFQKAYWTEMMESFNGPKVLDLCDPDWIKNGTDIIRLGALVHAITCSSERMVQLLRGYFPEKILVHVPDRLDFKFYPAPRKEHQARAKKVVWFGFIHNAHETLERLAPTIEKEGLELMIIANQPYAKSDKISALNPEFYTYDHATAYELIRTADIVLNPKSELSFFKYKSNNKSLISWKLGLPVAETNAELQLLMDPNERNHQVQRMTEVVNTYYDINQSAQQYRDILGQIETSFF